MAKKKGGNEDRERLEEQSCKIQIAIVQLFVTNGTRRVLTYEMYQLFEGRAGEGVIITNSPTRTIHRLPARGVLDRCRSRQSTWLAQASKQSVPSRKTKSLAHQGRARQSSPPFIERSVYKYAHPDSREKNCNYHHFQNISGFVSDFGQN